MRFNRITCISGPQMTGIQLEFTGQGSWPHVHACWLSMVNGTSLGSWKAGWLRDKNRDKSVTFRQCLHRNRNATEHNASRPDLPGKLVRARHSRDHAEDRPVFVFGLPRLDAGSFSFFIKDHVHCTTMPSCAGVSHRVPQLAGAGHNDAAARPQSHCTRRCIP